MKPPREKTKMDSNPTESQSTKEGDPLATHVLAATNKAKTTLFGFHDAQTSHTFGPVPFATPRRRFAFAQDQNALTYRSGNVRTGSTQMKGTQILGRLINAIEFGRKVHASLAIAIAIAITIVVVVLVAMAAMTTTNANLTLENGLVSTLDAAIGILGRRFKQFHLLTNQTLVLRKRIFIAFHKQHLGTVLLLLMMMMLESSSRTRSQGRTRRRRLHLSSISSSSLGTTAQILGEKNCRRGGTGC